MTGILADRRSILAGLLVLVSALSFSGGSALAQNDPLPSWNDGPVKKSITDFVGRVTREGGPDFVPVPERIATFDNDGTLWTEQPYYFQLAFAIDRIKAMAPQHPEWKSKQPFKGLLEGDKKALAAAGKDGLLQIVAATHAGMTVEEFSKTVLDWTATAKHPRFNRPYTELIFQPMLELLTYLRANGFKTFIVSGGGIEFMRPWADRVYGIPPEQVVGSSGVVKFEITSDGKTSLVKLPKIEFIDDGPGKPVGINRFIGRRPIFAFGNSDGDLRMLQYTAGGGGARFMGIVHHTDGEREFAYDRQSPVGKLDKALDEASKRGWTVVDMKKDWKVVFPVASKAADTVPVTAIDILLEPDATMLQRAEAVNATHLKIFPQGFALDAAHRPHVTLVQRFVRTSELDQLYAAVDKVFANSNATGMKLEAFKYYYIPSKDLGLSGIVAKPTPELLKLQADLITAVAPFTVPTGNSTAFVTTPDDRVIDPVLIDYVSTFVPKSSGEHFSPHVTTGLAPRSYLDKLLQEPFEAFTFSPAGAAVYQLGQFGTAARKLKGFELKPR
jgi:phosphoglycolate phosphatase-like HAD superfamily hydrolase